MTTRPLTRATAALLQQQPGADPAFGDALAEALAQTPRHRIGTPQRTHGGRSVRFQLVALDEPDAAALVQIDHTPAGRCDRTLVVGTLPQVHMAFRTRVRFLRVDLATVEGTDLRAAIDTLADTGGPAERGLADAARGLLDAAERAVFDVCGSPTPAAFRAAADVLAARRGQLSLLPVLLQQSAVVAAQTTPAPRTTSSVAAVVVAPPYPFAPR